MRKYTDHLILKGGPIKKALEKLNELAKDAILFVVDEKQTLIGSLTDGDVRRGLLKDLSINDKVEKFLQPDPKFIKKDSYSLQEIIKLRQDNFRVLPVVNQNREVVNVINFRFLKSYLPMDAVIMAGGKGERLKPMTNNVPKSLLKVGDFPIIEYTVERLRQFGVDDLWVSLRYLGDQILDYLGDGNERGINIHYVWEDQPLGTIGAVSSINDFQHEQVLITNSDILTTIDYEDFYLDFISKGADMAVVSIPYNVDIPYAVLETSDKKILSFSEKPTYTYYSNGGIYLIKTELLKKIPPNRFYNSTDLMQDLLSEGYSVISYPLRQYWLDIGKPADFEKAQEDIKHLDLS